MKKIGTLVCFAALAAALLTPPAAATVLYWFTGETYTTGTAFNFGTSVTADVGSAIAQVSDGTDVLPPGTPQAGQTSNNAQSYGITIATAPSPVPGRPGTKAVRFEVRALDFKYVGHRSELAWPSVPSGGVYWYSWSIYVPAGTDEPFDEALGQLHADDTVIASPVFSTSRSAYGNAVDWAIGQTTGVPSAPIPYDRVAFQFDRWVDWVVQVKFARDGTGFLNVWKDGKQVINKTNIYTDYPSSSVWPYFKFGNYKWPWKQGYYSGTFPTRVQYYDEIKIGDASETYASMAPRGKPAPTNLTAIGSPSSVALSWTASAPATSYNVKRSTTSGGPYTTLGSPSLTSYTDNTAVNNTSYYYVVSANTSVGESANSTQVNVTPYTASTAAPTFSPVAGIYSSPQSVTINSATSGSTIRYTTDGSVPSSTVGNVYSAPISVSTTQALNAVAYKAGLNPSSITSGLFTRQSSVALAPAAGAGWDNEPFTSPGNVFTVTFEAGASNTTSTAIIGLSNGAQTAFSSFATLISFGSNGKLTVRDGDLYKSDHPYSYAAGASYSFRMVVDVTNHTYSVYVTGPSGPETVLAQNYKFRTEQAGVTTLNSVGANLTGSGTFVVSEFAVSGSSGGGGGGGSLAGVDIGSPAVAGNTAFNAGTYSVSGAGSDIWLASDQFQYAYQTVTGNTTMIAKVTSVPASGAYPKAGIMIRETNAANSKYVFLAMTPSLGIRFHYRATTGGNAQERANSAGTVPYWIKLVRAGNLFTAYKSTNGTSWTAVASISVTMNSAVSIGLAVTSNNTSTLNTSTFTDVSVTTP